MYLKQTTPSIVRYQIIIDTIQGPYQETWLEDDWQSQVIRCIS